MKILFLGGCFLLATLTLWAEPAKKNAASPSVRFFRFQLDVFEERLVPKPLSEGDKVGLADSRTVEVPEGKLRGVFIANFTLDLTVKKEKKGIALDFRLVTLPLDIATKNGSALLDTGRVLTVADIPGKSGSRYRLAIGYLGTERKPVACSFEDFKWYGDPSARYDFWFVRNTWGDFHWNLLRDRVEDLTDSLGKIFNLVTAQKPEYYFAPCLLSDWVWDGRFYFSLEPSRRRALSAYGREANSFDPWVPNLLLFYLVWGQAPAPLVEGAAAFFDCPHFFAQQYLEEKKLDSVSQFLTTYRYRQISAEKGLMEAASFVRFLVERYGAGSFEQLYRAATDLSVKEEIRKIYGKSLTSLETEWRSLLANFRPEAEPLRRLAEEEFWNYRFADALPLYEKALALDLAPQADDYEDIGNTFYNLGRYDSALTFYKKAYAADSANWRRAYSVANFLLLLDDAAGAQKYYQKVWQLDTSVADGIVRQAGFFFESGNFSKAESLYTLALKKRLQPEDLAELNLNEGYMTWRQKGDFKKGNELLNAAWDFYRKARDGSPGVPLPYWRMGELFLYKNFADSAEASLNFALFLETRPYYLAKIFIRLGNLYDVLNRRPKALEYYRQALEVAAASPDRRRARGYLKKPFYLPAN